MRLVEAVSAHLLEVDGVSYRKIIGPATFLHNNTYLKCDTAMWNVQTNIIDAIGNIEILQEDTRLTSDRIEYVVAEDLAKFRGGLVELMDREGNVLNTNYLNYNTRDSIATFFNGASMRGKDGNIIESDNGIYNSAAKMFSFEDNVQIFTDSVFIVSDRVDYLTQFDKVVFNENTVAWKDENLLCANSGNFKRDINQFTFDRDGYILTKEQELWADLLIYYRNTGLADLYDNAQILDTLQKTILFADRIAYRPDSRLIELTDKPAVGLYSVEKEVADTLFMAGDTIRYYTKRMYEIDSAYKYAASERVKLSAVDPIAIHDAERRASRMRSGLQSGNNAEAGEKTSLEQMDKDGHAVPVDSTFVQDNVLQELQKDTSEVQFADVYNNVKFYRSDMQGLCDSLVYSGLDSMARLFKQPVVWYEEHYQFSADSLQGVIKNGVLTKVDLLSNAFIATQEDSIHFNQIKSSEMAAYFNNNELVRFDALGGVSSIFYMEEKGVLTLMDQEECKMLTARIKDNQIQRTRSIGDLKQNVYPVFNLSEDKQRLKGFEWRGEERPLSRFDVMPRTVKKSRRFELRQYELPQFRYTHKYFPDEAALIMDYRLQVLNEISIETMMEEAR